MSESERLINPQNGQPITTRLELMEYMRSSSKVVSKLLNPEGHLDILTKLHDPKSGMADRCREFERLLNLEETKRKNPPNRKSGLGVIYLIRAEQLGRFGARGYVGREKNLSLSRPAHHLKGNEPCTKHLIKEMRLKGCTPTFEILGQHTIKELDWREKQYATALTEAGWSLANRNNLAKREVKAE